MANATVKNTEESEAPVAPAPQVVHAMPMDDITRYVHANAVEDLELMRARYEETGQFELPVINPNKTRTIVLGGGRSKKIPVDIGWANRDVFVYAWLDRETASKPKFSGYRPVTKSCPANFAGGKPIPESYYGGKSYIGVGGEHILHFCKDEFAKSVKETTNNKALARLHSFKPGQRSVSVKDDDGQMAGGVTTSQFESHGFTED